MAVSIPRSGECVPGLTGTSAEKRQRTDDFSLIHIQAILDQTNSTKEAAKRQPRALVPVTNQNVSPPAINRVTKIYEAFDQQWKLLKLEQYPTDEVRAALFDNPEVSKMLFGTAIDKYQASLDHLIGCRVKNLKLRLRAAKDIDRLEYLTLGEKDKAESVLRDVFGYKEELLRKIWKDIRLLEKRGKGGDISAEKWRRELVELETCFKHDKRDYSGKFDVEGID